MTRFSKYKLCFALLLGLGLSSCDKDFEEINQNPNAPEDVPANVILPASQQSAVSRLFGASVNMTYASTWAQQVAKIQYIDEDRYQFRASDFSTHWDALYAGPLLDARLVVEKGAESGNAAMEGVGRTWQTWIFQNITDLWGDIPYTEALKGTEGNMTPKYDSQESIYTDMLKQLETANTLLASGGTVGGDLIYGGSSANWQKFANSLRLRLYIHMANVAPAKAKAGIEAIMANPSANPIFMSNADNAELAYLAAQPYRNPWYENSKTRDDHAISKTMVDILGVRKDPRLHVYARPAEKPAAGAGVTLDGKTYVGQPNGAAAQPSLPTVSRIGDRYRDNKQEAAKQNPTQPMYIMTYSEVMFILAEAAERGWNVGMTAEAAYNAGIVASMNQNGITDEAAIAAYLLQPSVAYSLQTNKREAISVQKWISLFTNGIEAFTEFRRTGYPSTIQEVPASAFPGRGVPLRFSYTDQERSTNRTNVEAASSGIVDFLFGKPVWWDVN
ncbi:SusD/RagB family nutrient-binding outer membrane lipoprotein [Pontibacter sp. JH31]|uniref:SusD/RagB family nutrient-binding outer membrane lipoprotein n=1 Tax=Pontibacter aquaedesilientis TaxID=2766980 RepID=A0ABR7XMF7_9BACT|nr:SusD/RagB family nutrient-binding outer membrane lipoprotein [Pontibacter aquaedesilientis]MBD1398606.1 SusD/RagB family nutrient-binding outer membrane lipoprotein [Pontibacter aquaedesilientis]